MWCPLFCSTSDNCPKYLYSTLNTQTRLGLPWKDRTPVLEAEVEHLISSPRPLLFLSHEHLVCFITVDEENDLLWWPWYVKTTSSQILLKQTLVRIMLFLLSSVKDFSLCQMTIQLMQSECAGTDFDTWINISYQITRALLRVTSFLFPVETGQEC